MKNQSNFKFNSKRLIDILISVIVLLLLSPLLIIVIILIKTTMPGPIFFRQERIGKFKKPFYIYKFRSMKTDLEAEKSFNFKKDNERLTKFGKILRRSKIDELPQILNIFKGDMSIVGPRPTIKNQVSKYNAEQLKRLNMKPGMTGLAQVNGNISLPWEKRIEYDLKYIDNFSLILDFKIIFKTFLIVLFGEERYKN